MKKLLYGICILSFVSLSAANLNIALKSEMSAMVNLANIVALANNENPRANRITFSYDLSGSNKEEKIDAFILKMNTIN